MNRKVGALWTKSYEKDGQTIPYYQGCIDLGLFGEQQVTLFHAEKRTERSPEYEMVTGRDEQKRNIGVFWKNTFQNDDGEEMVYLSGNIDAGVLGRRNVSIFLNTRKEKESQPDFNIVMRVDSDQDEAL